MTIVATTIVHPNPGVAWDDGGQGTNAIGILATADDWAAYGQLQQGLTTDPDFQGLMVDAGQIATWENYVSQTIDV